MTWQAVNKSLALSLWGVFPGKRAQMGNSQAPRSALRPQANVPCFRTPLLRHCPSPFLGSGSTAIRWKIRWRASPLRVLRADDGGCHDVLANASNSLNPVCVGKLGVAFKDYNHTTRPNDLS